jgi:hypothetical protein
MVIVIVQDRGGTPAPDSSPPYLPSTPSPTVSFSFSSVSSFDSTRDGSTDVRRRRRRRGCVRRRRRTCRADHSVVRFMSMVKGPDPVGASTHTSTTPNPGRMMYNGDGVYGGARVTEEDNVDESSSSFCFSELPQYPVMRVDRTSVRTRCVRTGTPTADTRSRIDHITHHNKKCLSLFH